MTIRFTAGRREALKSAVLMRTLKGFGANLYGQIVIAVTQLALVPIMAKGWGVDRYGIWLLIFTIPAYLALGEFGIGTAAGTRMTMEVARGDRHAALSTFQSALSALGGTALLIAIVGVVTIAVIPLSGLAIAGLTESQVRWALIALFLYGVLGILSSLPNAGFRCCGRYALGAAFVASMMLAEACVAVLSISLGADLVTVAFGYLAARTLGLTGQVLVLRKTVPWLELGVDAASWARIRDLVAPAVAVMALPLAQAVSLQGSAQVVGMAVSVAAVATFTSVRTLIRTGIQMTTLVNHAVMPELSAAASRGETATVRRIVAVTIATSLVVVVPGAAVLLLFGPDIVEIWTRGAIRPGYGLVAVMAGVMVVNGVWHPLSNLLLAVNRQATYSYGYAGASLVAIAAALPLTRSLGITGAAWAMLALDLVMLPYVMIRVSNVLLSKKTPQEDY